MNNKGFTLVELLAVIIIMSLLVFLVSTSVTKIISESKDEIYDIQIELIQEATKTWVADNFSTLSVDEECKYITLGLLKEYGLIDSDLNNPKTNKKFSDDMIIKITSKKSIYDKIIYEYEVNANQTLGCEYAYPSICVRATELTKTTGTIPTGEFKIGDEYICEVKEGITYNFFVVGEEASKVNLIMDRNISIDGSEATNAISEQNSINGIYTITKWNEDENYLSGPIKALEYINEATKTWEKIPRINETYEDENLDAVILKGTTGYKKITITSKARLPKFNEVYGSEKCSNGECPTWIKNYLNGSTQNIDGMLGYWLLSSYSGDNTTQSWIISNLGYISSSNTTNELGIRPVISIPKYLID